MHVPVIWQKTTDLTRLFNFSGCRGHDYVYVLHLYWDFNLFDN